MSKTVWFDNPWILLERLLTKIKTFFKQTESKDVMWFDNPWVWLDNATKKFHRYLTEEWN